MTAGLNIIQKDQLFIARVYSFSMKKELTTKPHAHNMKQEPRISRFLLRVFSCIFVVPVFAVENENQEVRRVMHQCKIPGDVNKLVRCVCSTILISIYLINAYAVQASLLNAQQVTPRKSPAPATKDKSRKRIKTQDVALVRSFAERTLDFQDAATKAATTSSLASLLWKHDETLARQLFLKAFDALNTEIAGNSDERNPVLEKKRLAYLRSSLIAKVARLDPDLAQRLITSLAQSGNSESDSSETGKFDYTRSSLYSARALLENAPGSAVEFAERSLRYGVDKEIRDFLFRLRLRDRAAADALFINVLNRLSTEPFVDAEVLMHLGAYVYTAADISANENGVALVDVGGQLVVDLSLPRPDVSVLATTAYLNAATDILSRPVSDPAQQKLYYIVSYQLYPKVLQLVPSRAPQLAAAMAARVPDISPALTTDSAYRHLSSIPKGEAEAGSPGKPKDGQKSDLGYLLDVSSLIQRGDYTGAQALADKIKNIDVRNQLVNVSKFYEAAKQINSDVEVTEKLAGRLDQSTERAILLLGIANKRIAMRDHVRGAEAVNHALKDIRSLDKSRLPLLLLTAAATLSAIDMMSAKEVCSEAIRAFDNQDVDVLSRAAGHESLRWMICHRIFHLQ
jgi:hypothetical protein